MKVDPETLFVELARSGSFSAAARALGISAAAVSKQISQLETRLGMALVIRNTRSLRLTEAGQAVLETYSNVIEAKRQLKSTLHDMNSTMEGQISVLVQPAFGHRILSPILKSFLSKYPDISFSITTSGHRENPVDGPYDLAVQLGHMEDSTLIVRKLVDCPIALFCSQTYLNQKGPIESVQDLKHHKFLIPHTLSQTETYKQKAFGKLSVDELHIAVSTNDSTFIIECMLHDLGIGALPLFLLSKELESRELVQLLPTHKMPVLPLYVVLPGSAVLPLRIREFVDHLVSETRREHPPMTGKLGDNS